MSVIISVALATVYSLYAFGVLGSPHLKYCLANQVDYHPYPYQSQRDMMAFLARKGTENLTKKFETIIIFGFVSNALYICFQIYKMSYKKKKGI